MQASIWKSRRHSSFILMMGLFGLELSLLAIVGCNPSEPLPETATSPRRTGLAITLRLDDRSDVTGMRFFIDRMSCAGESFEPYSTQIDKRVEDILLPGGIPPLEDQPFDSGSTHAFADLFLDLPAGCFRVATQPLTSNGSSSQKCAPASASRVRIMDGLTTEVLLINQCQSDGRGLIDIISALNHPPEIKGLTFEESKFVLQCADQVVCATMKDPEGDPIESTWVQASGPALYAGPEVLSTKHNPDGSLTQCIRAVAKTPGRYELTLTVHDQLHDPDGGGLIRFEDYFSRNGVSLPSHDVLTFPFYAASNGSSDGCEPVSCKQLLERSPGTPSGVYRIDPDGSGTGTPFDVWCDMTLDGGGWTLIGRGSWWQQSSDSLEPGTHALLTPSKLASVLASSSHLLRLGSGDTYRLFIADPDPQPAVGAHYWRTGAMTIQCATSYDSVVAGTMASTSTRAMDCDPLGVGSHTCGITEGWILWHINDTFNEDGGHPCAFGVSDYPTGGALTDLWVR